MLAASFFLASKLIDISAFQHCRNLKAIARDEQRIGYLYQWIEQNIKIEERYESLGYLSDIHHFDDRESLRRLGIDWEFLGIDFKHASFSVHRVAEEPRDLKRADSIKAVGFGEGRDEIVLKIQPGFKLEQRFVGIPKSDLEIVDDSVVVYCSSM